MTGRAGARQERAARRLALARQLESQRAAWRGTAERWQRGSALLDAAATVVPLLKRHRVVRWVGAAMLAAWLLRTALA